MTAAQKAEVVKLLHHLDGHLGLAVYRGGGLEPDWEEQGKGLILQIRQTVELLRDEMSMETQVVSNIRKRLRDHDFWPKVAEAIGEHPYAYDMDDESHRIDVVQVVCEAAARAWRLRWR